VWEIDTGADEWRGGASFALLSAEDDLVDVGDDLEGVAADEEDGNCDEEDSKFVFWSKSFFFN